MVEDVEGSLRRHGIEVWHRKDRFYAKQGVYQASVVFVGDCVKSALVRAEARGRAILALIRAKAAVQQMRRPPPPDSRPQRCHAVLRNGVMVCRPCGMRWPALDPVFPDCGGDR